ncbi:hypothetical protein T03_5994 [Trichinella britovi]|uniref:Uncharacterized protein n=1 Tax=Trichinella britovi TaxID=45882 RepID=A0A0V1CY36_TRIBR|nr:hypothetical protein T03_5994 [Trichinella britovi]
MPVYFCLFDGLPAPSTMAVDRNLIPPHTCAVWLTTVHLPLTTDHHRRRYQLISGSMIVAGENAKSNCPCCDEKETAGWIFPSLHFSRMFDDLTKRWTNGNSRLRFGRMVKHELTQARAAFWQVAKTQLNKRDTTCCYLDTIRVIWAEYSEIDAEFKQFKKHSLLNSLINFNISNDCEVFIHSLATLNNSNVSDNYHNSMEIERAVQVISVNCHR